MGQADEGDTYRSVTDRSVGPEPAYYCAYYPRWGRPALESELPADWREKRTAAIRDGELEGGR